MGMRLTQEVWWSCRRDYINTDLGALFRDHGGLIPQEKYLNSATKVGGYMGVDEGKSPCWYALLITSLHAW